VPTAARRCSTFPTDGYGEEFEDVTHRRPVLNKLRALTCFIPAWTLEETLDDLIQREWQETCVRPRIARHGNDTYFILSRTRC